MSIETRPISDKENRIQEFTVHFWNDRVIFDDKNLPVGQISADVLNLADDRLLSLRRKASETLDFMAKHFFDPRIKKDLALVTAVQDKLNEYQDDVLTFPLYEHLNIDSKLTHNTLTIAFKDFHDEFQRLVIPTTRAYQIYTGFINGICRIPDEIIGFRFYVTKMLDHYFENLKKRNAEHYAFGVYKFFSDKEAQRVLASLLPPIPEYMFMQTREAMIEYNTMPSPDDEKKYIIAERLVFTSIASFLHTDFFRGLMNGNALRRCHNCQRFFLLSSGYDTCYCNNIAPGETEKTCRKVGAHKKEARKEGKTPSRLEYDRVYNKLKTRRARGKISIDEWNAAVALALEYKDKAEAGKITELELKAIYDKM